MAENENCLLNEAGNLLVSEEEVLIFVPKYNRKRADATGAFHIGAIDFCAEHRISRKRIRKFDNNKDRIGVAVSVIDALEKEKPKIVVFFCHGYTHGVQFGVRSPNHPLATRLDKALWNRFTAALGYPSTIVALFACSTGDDPDGDPDTAPGSGEGSFADSLRDAIGGQCRIVAHTTSGHSWYNPMVKFFEGFESFADGAEILCLPGTTEFRKFSEALKTPWAFRFFLKQKSFVYLDLV